MEEKVLYSQILKNRRHTTPHRAMQEGTRVGQEAEGAGGQRGQEPSLWFSWESKASWVSRCGTG